MATDRGRDGQAGGTEAEPLPLGVLVFAWTLCVGLVIGAGVWAGVRLWPEKHYETDMPEAVVASAGQMIRDHRADRLVELIEAVPPDEAGTERDRRMRDLLIGLGRVLAAAQDLHAAVELAMPDELDRLARELEQAEARGETTSLLATLMPQRQRGRRGSGPMNNETPERREARERAFARILADPFGKLDDAVTENIDRVGIAEVGADVVAVTWDGRPVLPPFGLTMRRHEEGWRVVPPTSLPMVRRFMPETEAEFQVWGSLMATVEALLDDLRRDVQSGQIDSMRELSRRAVEDAVIPVGMVMVALGKADEEDKP